MSPEQCRGQEVDHRSDIYSLGLVTYEMLTGHRAFNAEALGELLLLQQTQAVTLPVDDSLPWPPGVEAALQRALHKDPAQRYDRPSELADALASAVGSQGSWAEVGKGPYEADPGLEPGLVQHDSFFHTRTIRGKRSRATIIALAVGLVCVGIAGIVAIVFGVSSAGEDETQGGDQPGVSTPDNTDAATAPRADGQPPSSKSGAQHRPFEVTIDVAGKPRRRGRASRTRRRPKKRPPPPRKTTTTKTTTTKAKRPEVVPGEPVRF
jgi:serine/threonine protein kinase